MKQLIIIFVAFFLCGCVSLTAGGGRVRVVNSPQHVEDCKLISQVTSSSSWGGLASGVAFDNAMNELKNKAAEMGGDTVYTTTMLNSWGGTRMIGDAYLCRKKGNEDER